MKEIPLQDGRVALVDDEDFELVSGGPRWYAWTPTHSRSTYVARGVKRDDGRRCLELLHRVILSDAAMVDHRNGDGLDNRRANLRPATHAENMRNSRLRRDNTSGYKGVSWHRHTGKWQARIRVNDGRRVCLGYFDCRIEAARAYDAAAVEFHGEFARLNFPREVAA